MRRSLRKYVGHVSRNPYSPPQSELVKGKQMLSRILCIVATAALITVTVSGAALADEGLPAKIVAKELYKTGKRVTIVRMLQPELIPGIYKVALEKAAKIQKYYEAMAASPDEGMLAKSASHAINHHSAKAAHAAAIKSPTSNLRNNNEIQGQHLVFCPCLSSAEPDFIL